MSSIYEVRAAALNEFLKTRAGLNSLFDACGWPGCHADCSVEEAIEAQKIEWGCYPSELFDVVDAYPVAPLASINTRVGE